MAEDSGTFKTYQAYLRRIGRFVIRKTTVAPLHHGTEIASHRQLPELRPRFLGNDAESLRYVRISLIRLRFELRFPRGERGKLYRHRVQMALGPWPPHRRGGNS
jgi:hypothetical protein